MQEVSDSVVLITIIGLISGASAAFFNQLFSFFDRRHQRYLYRLEIAEKKRREEKEFLISISSQIVEAISDMSHSIATGSTHHYNKSRAQVLGFINLVQDKEIEQMFAEKNIYELEGHAQIHEIFYKVIERLGHKIRAL
ncbi:MAG: hypothetical protein L0154_19325 [Chloroflexi bacterium]|nr:hypothetical protein [Chloroflexota bacterium]